MEILVKLFGGPAQVKIMRLFLFNPNMVLETKDVKGRARVPNGAVQREVSRLNSLGLIKRKSVYKETSLKTKKKQKKRRVRGWVLNGEFPFIDPLRRILLNSDMLHNGDIADKFKNIGSLKALVVSGVFVDELDRTNNRGRVDILLVGDRLNNRAIHGVIKKLESEIGRELHYTTMKTNDFLYRRGVYDKFIRDIFDYPHKILVNKLGL